MTSPTTPVLSPEDEKLIPTPDEAHQILGRFNASHFNLKEEHARYRIPADPKHDDDLRMAAFIRNDDRLRKELARLRALSTEKQGDGGGPAFPSLPIVGATDNRAERRDGMSLLQHYAGQILAGFCANPSIFAPNRNSGWSLVNATDEDLVGYAHHLAQKLIECEEMLTTEPRSNYRKAIFRDGTVVFEGTAHQVETWLSKQPTQPINPALNQQHP